MTATIWSRLGIDPTQDVTAIRRAYARALKAIDPEVDAEAFIALREARDIALAEAAGEGPPDEVCGASARQAAGPAMPRPGVPTLDEGNIRHIQFLLFGGGGGEPEELEAATRALLADPALAQVELAGQVEAFVADLIIRATPRSDPMIEPAIAYFRWGAGRSDLNRPPVIDWILLRREDRAFEAGLIAGDDGKYGRLLQSLRRPWLPLKPIVEWWRSPRVEYLLAYCQQLHPTTLYGLDQDNVGRWDQQFADMRAAKGLKAFCARIRRNFVWRAGLYHTGQTARTMWIALGVAGTFALAALSGGLSEPTDPTPRINSLYYTTPADDIRPSLDSLAPGQLTWARLSALNPALSRALTARWEQARASGEGISSFASAADHMIDEAYRAGLRGGGVVVQEDYWRVHADKLRWLQSRDGNGVSCMTFDQGGPHTAFPGDIEAREAAMKARALVAAPAALPARTESGKFSIPGPLFEDAANRARMRPALLSESLNDGGTFDQRCTARIALIEAALAQPPKVAAPFFRRMSAGL